MLLDLLDNNPDFLQLEESLHILEDSLQHCVLYKSPEMWYIKRLKHLYSPSLYIEHSETSSHYHATLQCIKALYLETDADHQIALSKNLNQAWTIYLR